MNRTNRYRPRLEVLEDRLVPSATKLGISEDFIGPLQTPNQDNPSTDLKIVNAPLDGGQDGTASTIGVVAKRTAASSTVQSLTLVAPANATAPTAMLTVMAPDGYLPCFSIDVDLNHDGKFSGDGEIDYTQGTLDPLTNTGQTALYGLVAGTYAIQARAQAPDGSMQISNAVTLHWNAAPTAATQGAAHFNANLGQFDPAQDLTVKAGVPGAGTAKMGPELSTTNVDGGVSTDAPTMAGDMPVPGISDSKPAGPQVSFVSQTRDYTAFITADGGVTLLGSAQNPDDPKAAPVDLVQRVQFAFSNPNPTIAGEGQKTSYSNYYLGNDPTKWRSGVADFSQVRAQNVYDGIDVVYRPSQGRLEFDVKVAAGADLTNLALSFPDASVSINDQGQLVLTTATGTVTQDAPVAYQMVNGVQQTVRARYVLEGWNTVGFDLAGYNPDLPLVIDPTFIAATYIGGSLNDTTGRSANQGGPDMAVDGLGDLYVAGVSSSSNYPVVTGSIQTTRAGNQDAVITKVLPAGNGLIWSTYFGGTQNDLALGLALDSSASAYITGQTASTNFPVTAGAFQTTAPGGGDGFVTKITPTGTLVYSTYLGGTGNDFGRSIAVDPSANAYITGETGSSNFPISAGAFRTTAQPGFLTKLNSTGTGLVFSTYFGGSLTTHPRQVVLDSALNPVVVGDAFGGGLPTTTGSYQPNNGGGLSDGFVFKFSATGTALVWGTYLGGSATEGIKAVALDSVGSVYVTGDYNGFFGGTFPTTAGVLEPTNAPGNGSNLGFVSKLSADGRSLLYSTFYGGNGDTQPYGIAIDGVGDAFIVGSTLSTNLPTTTNAVQRTFQSNSSIIPDGFIAELNPTANQVLYGTYIGGPGSDVATDVFVAGSSLWAAGTTDSTSGFPVTTGVFQTTNGGGNDIWVSAVGALATPPPPPSGGGGGGGFWDQTRDTIGGIPGAVGDIFKGGGSNRAPFQSDHCFDNFCSPVSNPFYFMDPRSLTEIKPLLIFQHIPGSNPYFKGGDAWFYGVQGSVAVNEVFSVEINKLGFVTLHPHDKTLVNSGSGFSELSFGPKFTFIRNESSKTLLAGGINLDLAVGSSRVFQDTGDVSLIPYVSFAQNFGKSSFGSFNFMNTTGYSLATDNVRNDFFFSSFHLDYDVANLNKIFPLIEVNWFAFTQNGGSNKFFGFEGRDLVNFGSGGIAGHQDLSMALGARYKFAEWFQVGAVVEFPLTNHQSKELMDYRLGFDLIFRY